ncbi:SLAM family member 5 isoform 3-T3 [Menidia menidia]
MAGGRPSPPSGVLANALLLLLAGVGLAGAGASAGSRLIQKKVGDDVEISSDLPTEGVTTATWKYGEKRIADLSTTYKDNQFQGRLEFNHKNFSLTLRRLTLQDSGEYLFLSDSEDKQRPTVTITLQVHESITAPPVLSANLSLQANGSCAVWLECTAAAHRNVLYSWTVGGHSHSGPRLQYLLTPPEGDATFTCTASNFVSSQSQSTTLTCASREPEKASLSPGGSLFVLAVAGGLGLVVLLVCAALAVHCCKKTGGGGDSTELTVYADISEVAADGDASLMPCSLYETIDHPVTPAATPAPQTIYDKVQLSRLRKASVSPYQEVS